MLDKGFPLRDLGRRGRRVRPELATSFGEGGGALYSAAVRFICISSDLFGKFPMDMRTPPRNLVRRTSNILIIVVVSNVLVMFVSSNIVLYMFKTVIIQISKCQ